MNARKGRTAPCEREDSAKRLDDARGFMVAAELMRRENPDVSASNAVLAGIAAADSICCRKLGERSRAPDHVEAVKVLGRADREGARALGRLLATKTKAQYQPRGVSRSTVDDALRNARRLIELAERT